MIENCYTTYFFIMAYIVLINKISRMSGGEKERERARETILV
jgi:hypothetical protein